MSKKEIPTDAIERNRAWIKAEIVQAIGLGDECCEFVVHFDK